jgi:hypothetical protein
VAVFSHKGTLLHADSIAASITVLRILCDVHVESEETVDHQHVICEKGEAAEIYKSRVYRNLFGGIQLNK